MNRAFNGDTQPLIGVKERSRVGKLNELLVQLLPLLSAFGTFIVPDLSRGGASGIFNLECPIVIRERAARVAGE